MEHQIFYLCFLDVPICATMEFSTVVYSMVVLNAHLWNIPPWHIQPILKLRNCGIFHSGTFHRCALNTAVEYSSVECSTVARWKEPDSWCRGLRSSLPEITRDTELWIVCKLLGGRRPSDGNNLKYKFSLYLIPPAVWPTL